MQLDGILRLGLVPIVIVVYYMEIIANCVTLQILNVHVHAALSLITKRGRKNVFDSY